jgi:hypothetical protein
MANLAETAQWHEHIYQLAITDKVKGGPDGAANIQPQQLAERTKYLKTFADEVKDARGEAPSISARMEDMEESIKEVQNGSMRSAEDVIEQLSQYSFLADDPRRAMGINMSLSGLPTVQNADGSETELEDGDIVLLYGQADGTENGMWIIHEEDWERHPAYPEGDISCFTDKFIVPREGLFAHSCFYLETDPYIVGETPLNFLRSMFATAAIPGKIPVFDKDGNISGIEGGVGVTNVFFTGLTANGSESNRTTKLTLVFGGEIPGLSVSDIEFTSNGTGAVAEALSETGIAGTYEFAVSGITESGAISVAVAKPGFNFSPQSRPADVYYAAGTVVAASANGSTTVTSTEITLTFTGDDGELMDIDDLTAADITLGAGVTKGSLTNPSTGVYKLGISGLSASNSVSVSVTKAGYDIDPYSQDVYCHYAVPVSLNSATPNQSGGTTISVTLTFSAAITGLAATDFTVTANGTGATRGSLSGSGPSYVLTLGSLTASGTVSIAVSKPGFAVSGSPKSIAIVKSPYNYDGAVDNTTMGSDNLLTKLSVATVAEAVDILHTMINADGVSGFGNLHVGDYLDLPSITIAADSDTLNDPSGIIVNDTTYENLRLVIAGFNLWKGLDGNTKNHILLAFKHIPCRTRQNITNYNTGGYPASKQRAFLLDEFLTGLKTALGTTNKSGYHYPVKRHISAKGSDTTVQDELFLFNEKEIFGVASYGDDGSVNQVYIPWFKNNTANCIKNYNGSAGEWWEATPSSSGDLYFCMVQSKGTAYWNISSNLRCCSPGFCLS